MFFLQRSFRYQNFSYKKGFSDYTRFETLIHKVQSVINAQ